MSRFFRGCIQAERARLRAARQAQVPVLVLWEGPSDEGWAGLISSAPAYTSMLRCHTEADFWASIDRLSGVFEQPAWYVSQPLNLRLQ